MSQFENAKIGEVDAFKGFLWTEELKLQSGFTSMAQIERAVSPNNFKRRNSESGGYVYPCYFSKIRRGETLAGRKLVFTTNIKFPGSSYLYNHPFWDVLKNPEFNAKTLISCISKIRSKSIRSILYARDNQNGIDGEASNSNTRASIIDTLQDALTLDAFTAVLIILKAPSHAEKSDARDMKKALTELSLSMFPKVFADLPWFCISDDVFRFLIKNLYDPEILKSVQSERNPEGMDIIVALNRSCLDIVDILGLLKHHEKAPVQCLPIARKLLLSDAIFEGFVLRAGAGAVKSKDLTFVQEIADELFEWEIEFLKNNTTNLNHK